MKRKKILVIGLGVLGDSVAKNLTLDGAEVIVLDQDSILIDRIKDHVSIAMHGDSTDRKALEQLGAKDIDAAVICIGTQFEAAVLTAAHLLDLNVSFVAVRANNELAASILRRIGVHEVFFVESEMGKSIAHRMQSPSIKKEMEIGDGYRIIQWEAPEWMDSKSIMDLAVNKEYKVQIVGIRPTTTEGRVRMPYGDTIIHQGDLLLLAGQTEDLDSLLHAKH